MNPTERLADWEVELLTPEIGAGDLVKLTKGEELRQGRARVAHRATTGRREAFVSGAFVRNFVARGWSVTVIEKAPVPLPTEPGIYTAHPDSPHDWEHYIQTGTRTGWMRITWGDRAVTTISEDQLRRYVGTRELVKLEASK